MAKREYWGCRTPVPDDQPPPLQLGCWACHGNPEACEVCEGTGRIPIRTCPHKMFGAAETLVCLAAEFLANGQMPIAGVGWAELPAKFVDAVYLVSSEREHIRNPKEE